MYLPTGKAKPKTEIRKEIDDEACLSRVNSWLCFFLLLQLYKPYTPRPRNKANLCCQKDQQKKPKIQQQAIQPDTDTRHQTAKGTPHHRPHNRPKGGRGAALETRQRQLLQAGDFEMQGNRILDGILSQQAVLGCPLDYISRESFPPNF